MDIQNIRAEVNYRKQNSNQQNQMFFSDRSTKTEKLQHLWSSERKEREYKMLRIEKEIKQTVEIFNNLRGYCEQLNSSTFEN